MSNKRPWQKIRIKYIQGDLSLRELSNLYQIPLSTLKKRSMKERWSVLRNQYRTKVELETLERAAKLEAEELLGTRTRHIKISRALQAKAIARLKDLDPNELSPEETRRFLEAGVRIERLILGEATERFDLGAVARFAEKLELMKNEDIILLYQRLLEES
jgi:hypothetical protein